MKSKRSRKSKTAHKRPLHGVVRRTVTGLGERMKKARQVCEMTQAALAKETGLKPSAISHFEGNRRTPNVHNLYAICAAMGCQSDYLLALQGGREDWVATASELSYIRGVLNMASDTMLGRGVVNKETFVAILRSTARCLEKSPPNAKVSDRAAN